MGSCCKIPTHENYSLPSPKFTLDEYTFQQQITSPSSWTRQRIQIEIYDLSDNHSCHTPNFFQDSNRIIS